MEQLNPVLIWIDKHGSSNYQRVREAYWRDLHWRAKKQDFENYPSLAKGDNGTEMEMPEDRPRNLIPGGDKFSPLELGENSW